MTDAVGTTDDGCEDCSSDEDGDEGSSSDDVDGELLAGGEAICAGESIICGDGVSRGCGAGAAVCDGGFIGAVVGADGRGSRDAAGGSEGSSGAAVARGCCNGDSGGNCGGSDVDAD